MADMKNGKGLTKADVILSKLEKLSQQTAQLESRVNAVGANAQQSAPTNNDAVIRKLTEENAKIKQEIRYVSAQIEGVCLTLTKMLNALPSKMGAGMDVDDLSSRVAAKIIIPENEGEGTARPVAVSADVDYERLAEEVAKKIAPAQTQIDYEELGFSVAKKMYIPQAVAEEVDYDLLAQKVAEKLPGVAASETAYATALPDDLSVQADIDYDLLAQKVAEAVSVQEAISPDYIAAKVAEQIVIPQTASAEAQSVDLDVEELSRKVADKIAIPAYEAPETISEERIAEAVVKNLSDAIDSDEIADCVAKRVGSISPEQFEITVDDDGCDSLAKAVESKLDYDMLAASVAEKLNPAFMAASGESEIDSEELARAISERLSVNADINEDVLADKAAAVLSNYMPEVDSNDIADKVIAGIIPALPSTPVIDSEVIASSVTEKLMEKQEDSDYDIVIDEDGLGRITDCISEEMTKENDERYAKIDEEINGIKQEYGERFDKLESDVAEIKEMLLIGVVVAAGASEMATTQVVEEVKDEALITVSDLVGEETTEEEVEEEVVEEPEEVEESDIVEEIDENLTDDEFMPEDMEAGGGVDFAHMMKYNRSFIARIIQGTDEQKNYYGQVKTALLSYKKVNSNIAWGAERFNKGRETIARFKIRGKTLCLYLALDPNEFETSVYHQADVSDNKSMHGTPMMVKIKSPRGVKKAIRLIDEMLSRRNGEKHNVAERDYAAMYPYETIEELIEDGLVKDVNKG